MTQSRPVSRIVQLGQMALLGVGAAYTGFFTLVVAASGPVWWWFAGVTAGITVTFIAVLVGVHVSHRIAGTQPRRAAALELPVLLLAGAIIMLLAILNVPAPSSGTDGPFADGGAALTWFLSWPLLVSAVVVEVDLLVGTGTTG